MALKSDRLLRRVTCSLALRMDPWASPWASDAGGAPDAALPEPEPARIVAPVGLADDEPWGAAAPHDLSVGASAWVDTPAAPAGPSETPAPTTEPTTDPKPSKDTSSKFDGSSFGLGLGLGITAAVAAAIATALATVGFAASALPAPIQQMIEQLRKQFNI